MSYEEVKAWRERTRQKCLDRLGGRCVVCGSTNDLEFDHVDPNSKVEVISQAIVAGWSWDRLLIELKKCQLLCKPHHISKSQTNKELGGGSNKTLNPRHGTAVLYAQRCRCAKCREWKKQYRQKLVDTQGKPR